MTSAILELQRNLTTKIRKGESLLKSIPNKDKLTHLENQLPVTARTTLSNVAVLNEDSLIVPLTPDSPVPLTEPVAAPGLCLDPPPERVVTPPTQAQGGRKNMMRCGSDKQNNADHPNRNILSDPPPIKTTLTGLPESPGAATRDTCNR